jgi:hypothetical protein
MCELLFFGFGTMKLTNRIWVLLSRTDLCPLWDFMHRLGLDLGMTMVLLKGMFAWAYQ